MAEKLTFTGKYTEEGRPVYVNADGEWVTERTITENVPELGGFVNIPTVLDGRFLDPQQAIDLAIKTSGKDIITGRKLPVFKDLKTAVSDAEERSKGLGVQLEKLLNPLYGATFK